MTGLFRQRRRNYPFGAELLPHAVHGAREHSVAVRLGERVRLGLEERELIGKTYFIQAATADSSLPATPFAFTNHTTVTIKN